MKIFWAFCLVNIHLLCYWPTIQNLISKICPKFQVTSSHFFKVNELLDKQGAKNCANWNISTPIYIECDKMYRSKVYVQELPWYSIWTWYWTPALQLKSVWGMSLEKSLMRPSFFLYFRKIRNKRSHWPGGQLAPRLYNCYNLCPCARPAHVGECWPGPEFKFSKTVEVRWSC